MREEREDRIGEQWVRGMTWDAERGNRVKRMTE